MRAHCLRASGCGTPSSVSCSADHGLKNVLWYYVQIPEKVKEVKLTVPILLREMESQGRLVTFPFLHCSRILPCETRSLAAGLCAETVSASPQVKETVPLSSCGAQWTNPVNLLPATRAFGVSVLQEGCSS